MVAMKKFTLAAAGVIAIGAAAVAALPTGLASGTPTPSVICKVDFRSKPIQSAYYSPVVYVKNKTAQAISTTIIVVTSIYFPGGTLSGSETDDYPVAAAKGQKVTVVMLTRAFPPKRYKTVYSVTGTDVPFTCSKGAITR
jgi:hypothetical protein